MTELRPGDWILSQTPREFREPTTFAHLVGQETTDQFFLTDSYRLEQRFQDSFEQATLSFIGQAKTEDVPAALSSLATVASIQETDFIAVALPLRGRRPFPKAHVPEGVSLILISPTQTRSYSDFREWLSAERIEEVSAHLQRQVPHLTYVAFPTFSTSDKIDLCVTFAELECSSDETESWLAYFAHRPALTVSADGTLPYAQRPEGPAVAKVLAMAGTRLVFDRPFYFLLRSESGEVLSMGSFAGF